MCFGTTSPIRVRADTKNSPDWGSYSQRAIRKLKHLENQLMNERYSRPKQSSRVGKTSICIFVKPEKKCQIIGALAAQGYGTTFQEGITNLLDTLIDKEQNQLRHVLEET